MKGVLLIKPYTTCSGMELKPQLLTMIGWEVYKLEFVCSIGTPAYKEYINDFGFYEEFLANLKKHE